MSRILLLLVVAFAGACAAGTEDSAVRRGDVAFAADSLKEALAEYQLALRQGDGGPEVLARVAHTFALLGRVDPAAEYYRLAAEADERFADQGAADLMHLAREAEAGNDRFRMATAVTRAQELRPGLGLGDMALPLARHFYINGEFGRALPLYRRVLIEADTAPRILMEVGQAYEETGDCRQALLFFERFRAEASRAERVEADWHIGTCGFEVASDLLTAAQRGGGTGNLEEALRMIDRTIEVGEPQHLLSQAWFNRGEILAALGDCSGAMDAFAEVRALEPGGAGALANMARERFDAIRFGRGLSSLRGSSGCY
ncbi:tetratricopeptide repeat protein [Gemmatimonadota bacterium DH-20]|uniref:Tetratricopeptide repeat protein n=1 Tax=Gaopeijia maritima TaxID=3119007 RepID=A0ABU9E9S2_9BACT